MKLRTTKFSSEGLVAMCYTKHKSGSVCAGVGKWAPMHQLWLLPRLLASLC